MCLRTIMNEPQVMDEDMPVYKVIGWNNLSLYHRHKYFPGFTYRLGMPLRLVPRNFHGRVVTVGFHAYYSVESARNIWRCHNPDDKVVEFIIPQGAHFIMGMDGDVVSDAIRAGNLTAV